MKKISLLLAALILTLALTACSDSNAISDSYVSTGSESQPTESQPAESESTGPVVTDYTFTPPAGFTASKDDPNLYYSPDYPDDIANVIVASSEHDPYFGSYTADLMADALSTALAKQLGNQFSGLAVDSFEYFEVDTLPAYRMTLHYTYEEMVLKQLVVCVNADSCYAFTYTQTADTDWDAVFEASVAALHFEVE